MFCKLFIHFFEAFSPFQDLAVCVTFGVSSGRLVIYLCPGQPGPELDLLRRNQGHKQFLVVGQIIDVSVSKPIPSEMQKKL
jgi:hypothetical protein